MPPSYPFDPFVCSGDFNGDGLQDFALVLRDSITASLKLIVFHQAGEKGYSHFMVAELPEVEPDEQTESYIVCEKPGERKGVDGPSIHVQHDNISVFYGASAVFYFKHGVYHRLITSLGFPGSLPDTDAGKGKSQGRLGLRFSVPPLEEKTKQFALEEPVTMNREEIEKREKQFREDEGKVKAAKSIPGLSRHLSLYLQTHFTELRVLTRDDASEENYRLATSERHQPSPFICLGDFNGDGLQDTAILLRDKTTQKLKLMAFHQKIENVYPSNPPKFKKKSYQAYSIEETQSVSEGNKLNNFISCNKPGKFEPFYEADALTLILERDSITLEFTMLYYFIGGRYQSLEIGGFD